MTFPKPEFALFPNALWRVNPPILNRSLPKGFVDPWARRDAWRYHSFFSLKNRVRALFPGFGLGASAFAVYLCYDYWYQNEGPGREERQKWQKWMHEREERLKHEEPHH
ncbi:NADH-ubiquinone oxidoreductase B12 subunit family-domain-containing protein [Polychytrium aggregatum]|uniref:NADH-ubiquinone oxidoreductase B12 subunit family-domain-containing protein n=1 Tax=Polychytrium aggregatum TaxID=110093 RepID=UPI0022FE63E9|nr:NADH-ubiquinone oxidoreductase B12 subunit family-domain-containing protein [Polychytrium aggregatum]KAI9207173.1 NADH-ubiquinone oxidoreductase B12 subunit family-domain-containing protein [Polychytrium aggregatum]